MEIVRRIYEAVARGDNATVLAAYDAEVEFDFSRSPFREIIDRPHTLHGAEGVRSFIRERYEAWETVADHLEALIDARGCADRDGGEQPRPGANEVGPRWSRPTTASGRSRAARSSESRGLEHARKR